MLNDHDEDLGKHQQAHDEFWGLINQYLDLKRWGFVQTYFRMVGSDNCVIIVDNQSCRVRLFFQTRDQGNYREREVPVFYGRRHAVNTGYDLYWKRESCRCWHGLWYYVIDFLDGLSPAEIFAQFHRQKASRILEEFERTYPEWELWGDVRTRYAIKDLRLHSEIWGHYGQRLFDLFDVRNPDLWQSYVKFHNEVKKLLYEERKARTQAEMPFRAIEDFVPDKLC